MIRSSTLQTASCEEPTKYRYQRGGVIMATMGKMTGRIGSTGEDIMGLSWLKEKYKILLMLDANDDLDSPDFGRFLDQTDLYDILGNHHSVNSPPHIY